MYECIELFGILQQNESLRKKLFHNFYSSYQRKT